MVLLKSFVGLVRELGRRSNARMVRLRASYFISTTRHSIPMTLLALELEQVDNSPLNYSSGGLLLIRPFAGFVRLPSESLHSCIHNQQSSIRHHPSPC
jgi:hypothetical protein